MSSFPNPFLLFLSCCPQRKTVTAPTPASLTASTGRPLEAGLRNWMNMDTLFTSLNTHRRRCGLLIKNETLKDGLSLLFNL